MKTVQIALLVSLSLQTFVRAGLDRLIEEPIEVMRTYSEAGDPGAQFNLAQAFADGTAGERNVGESIRLFRQAAQSGFPSAQYHLGFLYQSGSDIPQDEAEALRWFVAAGKCGVIEAQMALIRAYLRGPGEKSPIKALWWDFIARKTLNLRYGTSPGEPLHPSRVRADGAAEMRLPDGRVEIVFEDFSIETTENDGTRRRRFPDGKEQLLYKNGDMETRYASGVIVFVEPGGRRTVRDDTQHVEITDPDGKRSIEGDGTDSHGRTARILDQFDAKKAFMFHRITSDREMSVEYADGSRTVETKVQGEGGVEMKLIEKIAHDDSILSMQLIRVADGLGPTGDAIWSIHRKLKVKGRGLVEFLEKYSSAGLYAQEIIADVDEAKEDHPIVKPAEIPSEAKAPRLAPASVIGSQVLIPRVGVFGEPKEPIDPVKSVLNELAALEKESRNFAGATEADFLKARAAAIAYVIPLLPAPQKTNASSTLVRDRSVGATALRQREEPLAPITDDQSKLIPLGFHGRDAISMHPWKHGQTSHFVIHYLEEADARQTIQYIEGAYFVVTNLLNLDTQRFPGRTHVFLFPNREQWRAYLETVNLPPEVGGFAYKTELLLPVFTEHGGRDESVKTLCHEVTHAVISRFYAGRKIPLWLSEGLAEYLAARTVSARRGQPIDKLLSKKSSAQIDVTELVGRQGYRTPRAAMPPNTVFREDPNSLIQFYANAEKCVRVLCEKLPGDGFPRFLNALVAGNLPDAALRAAYGQACPDSKRFDYLVNSSH